MLKDIIAAEPQEGRRLLLTFEDGEQRAVDLAELVPFTELFEPLRDDAFFRQVRVSVDLGTVVWPNGADLCPEVLYEAGRPVSSRTDNSNAASSRWRTAADP